MASQDFPRIEPDAARAVARLVHGATFDDFLLTPQRSVLARRDPAAIDLSCRVSQHLTLKRPIVSANMDTVTRAPMAIVQAEEGGIGIIDRGFRAGDIQPQVREVEIVKRTQHGVIARSVQRRAVRALGRRGGADGALARRHAGRRRRGAAGCKGLLTERDLRFVQRRRPTRGRSDDAARSAGRAPGAGLAATDAERMMVERKVKKLPLVDADGTLLGLVTARDLDQAAPPAVRHARRAGTASRRRRDRRDRRLPRARRRARSRRAWTCSSSTSRTAIRR